MKKLIYCALALAAGLFAASCQQENLEPVAGGNTVTYTVELPGVDTKAIGDGSNINQLVYEVWRTENPNDVTLEPGAKTELLYRVADKPMANGSTIIELDLVNDQNYTILFWAQVRDGGYYNTGDLRNVTLTNKSSNAFEENRAAFYGVDFIKATDQRKVKQTVTLTRPFGQVNLGTEERTAEQQAVYELKVVKTAATVKGASTAFNVATGVASATERVDMKFTVVTPLLSQKLNDKYQWISMNYVFVPANQATFEVDYTIETNHGVVTNTISNIPAKKNYRTNIVGNLLTSKTEYTVNLDTRWDGDDFNTTVIEEGIVKNANGDYEVSTPHGLAYMLNNLFKEDHVLAEGGNFYLTAAEYDMTDMIVESPSVPADKTLNIYGETPVVTRSTTGFAGITIKGLTQPLIGNVKGAVSVSGVTLDDEGSVLVKKNEGTVVVSEVEADVIVPEGDGNIPPVSADSVGNLGALKTSLASGVKVIEIAADIEANEIISISRSVTINGNGNTFTTSANRAFRLTASEIEVVFNDLQIVSTATMIYPEDVRGVSIDGSLSNVILTLNDCTIRFTDSTTCDWTYAVNVSGSGIGHKVTVIGGAYEGANVINVHSAKNTVTVKDATLTCKYPASDLYYGACIWVLQNQESSVYAEGNTFNGSNAIAFNLGTGTTLEEKDNTDNTNYYRAKVGNVYYYSIADALKAIEKEGTVKVLYDAELPYTVISAAQDVTIDLNGKTLSNITTGNTNPQDAILVKGNLTLKNGTITTEHKGENLGWSAQSTVFNITAGGIVNLEKVTAKNLGGTDMGFVAHLNNWGEATFNADNCTLEANYVAVRVFNSGPDKNNVTIKNSTLKGGNYAFWVHNYTPADFGTAEKAAAQYKLLNFNITEGNTFVGKNETPIRLGMTNAIYITADQIGNLPTYASVTSEETLIAALKNASSVNSIIYFANDITISNKWDNRYTGAKISKPIEINGNGKTLKFTGLVEDMNYMSVFRFENVATVKNLTIDLSEAANTGQMRAISCKSTLSVENCTFIGKSDVKSRGIIFGESATNLDFSVSIKNSEFINWKRGITDNENGKDIKSVVIEGNTCTNAHVYLSAYESITFTGNEMTNSVVNITSYTAASTAKVTAIDNTLDSNQYNVIGSESKMFSIANVNAQDGFTVNAQ